MPIFHKQKLIFIHIPKNAGKSIESAFFGKAGPGFGKRNHLNAACKLLLRLTSSTTPRRDLLGSLDFVFAAQHMTLKEITELGLVTPNNCPCYQSFAVVRNPFDRAISSVFHHFAIELHSGTRSIKTSDEFASAFRSWLDSEAQDHNHIAHKRTQWDFLSLDGRTVGVDNLIRYEFLAEDFEAFCKNRCIEPVSLGWSGKNNRNRDYREYFSQEARGILERSYAEDLDHLGYTF